MRYIPRPGRRALLGAALGTPLLPSPARPAPSWSPDGPVRILVGAAPGGVTDILARIVAEAGSAALGQPVVVENPSGASGNIAAAAAARARPDGRTLLLGFGALVANRLRDDPPGALDPLRDLLPVARVGTSPATIMVHARSGIADFPALAAALRARRGEATWAPPIPGTLLHLVGQALLTRLGVNAEMIPYRGSGAVVPDFLAGRLDFVCDTPSAYLSYLKDGTLRAVAVAAARRSPLLPDVPALADFGVEGIDGTSWWGLLAPAAIPRPAAEAVAAIVRDAVTRPATRTRMAALCLDPAPAGPEEFAALISGELTRWRPVAAAL